jgi:hypothetical protein
MLEDRTERQIVFYDQGIGTDSRKILGSIAGPDSRKTCCNATNLSMKITSF